MYELKTKKSNDKSNESHCTENTGNTENTVKVNNNTINDDLSLTFMRISIVLTLFSIVLLICYVYKPHPVTLTGLYVACMMIGFSVILCFSSICICCRTKYIYEHKIRDCEMLKLIG